MEELPNPDKFIISNTQIYKIYKRNNNTLYLNDILKFHNLLFIIESARIRKIVGFNYKTNEWIAFANNAITHYSSYWEYIEFAFKKYNLWDYLIKLDSSKGTFQRKLQELYSSFPEQKYDFEEIFQTLYPELI